MQVSNVNEGSMKRPLITVPVVYSLYFTATRNPLTLGCHVGLDPQRDHFALEIPTCWYRKSLPDPTRLPADPPRSLTDPTRAQHEQVEYWSCWGSCWPCTFHVVCVNFIRVRWPTRTQFLVEYGVILKAYIPLQRKITWVRSLRWVQPPTREVRIADTNMLVS